MVGSDSRIGRSESLARIRMFLAAFLVFSAAAACTKQDPLYCDETTACAAGHQACDLGGVCPGSEFIKNTCIADEVVCWDGSVQVSDAASDAGPPPDAGLTDAALVTAWDIAFGDHYYLASSETLTSGFVRIANTGTATLDLATLELESVTHDAPAPAAVDLLISPITTTLRPGEAGGHLAGPPLDLIVDDGLMTEPNVDGNRNYFALQITGLPQQWSAFSVEAVVSAQGRQVVMVIEIEPSITGATAFDSATRMSSTQP
jgi:hypothetical protein